MGISLDVFWGITPWQLTVCIDAHEKIKEIKYNHEVWLMWHNAALSQTPGKKFPPLKSLLYKNKNQVNGIDETAIIERLKAHNNKLEVNHGTDRKTKR